MNRLKLPISSKDVSVIHMHDLPRDLKRVLKVQWKEFLHYVEDNQVETKIHQLNNGKLNLSSRSAA